MDRRRHQRSTTPGKQEDTPLPLGKIPPRLLEKVLADAVLVDASVLQGPGIGSDAAIIGPPRNEMLVVTSDPITFTTSEVGRHLLAININDITTTGACPCWLMLNLLFPPGTTEAEVDALFSSIGAACKEHEITLVGGHTEVTDAVTRPVAMGTLLGTVKNDRRVDPSRAQPGDCILLMGPIAIEGTAVLARERGMEIDKALGKEMRVSAEELLFKPGICVRELALLAVSRYLAHALHDPTEGGLATALHELAAFTGWGLEVDRSMVNILPETEAICELFQLDPFGLLASGSLLVIIPESEAERLQKATLHLLGVRSTVIGRLTTRHTCVWRDNSGAESAIPQFARDELARLLEKPITEARSSLGSDL